METTEASPMQKETILPRELSDEELDAVAGGLVEPGSSWHFKHPPRTFYIRSNAIGKASKSPDLGPDTVG